MTLKQPDFTIVESLSGFFDSRDYFTSLRTFLKTAFYSCHVGIMYVVSLDINPADLLAACIKLLERMRDETHAAASEKSVVAIPKYMSTLFPNFS